MKTVGLTQATGFQIGVRRTFQLSVQEAWELITSDKGTQAWLGSVSSIQWVKGERFQTQEGVSGEITTINPYENIRLSWTRNNWDKPSIVQIRTIPSGTTQTTISFHQEKLDGPDTREAMKLYWKESLDRLKNLLS